MTRNARDAYPRPMNICHCGKERTVLPDEPCPYCGDYLTPPKVHMEPSKGKRGKKAETFLRVTLSASLSEPEKDQ